MARSLQSRRELRGCQIRPGRPKRGSIRAENKPRRMGGMGWGLAKSARAGARNIVLTCFALAGAPWAQGAEPLPEAAHFSSEPRALYALARTCTSTNGRSAGVAGSAVASVPPPFGCGAQLPSGAPGGLRRRNNPESHSARFQTGCSSPASSITMSAGRPARAAASLIASPLSAS